MSGNRFDLVAGSRYFLHVGGREGGREEDERAKERERERDREKDGRGGIVVYGTYGTDEGE